MSISLWDESLLKLNHQIDSIETNCGISSPGMRLKIVQKILALTAFHSATNKLVQNMEYHCERYKSSDKKIQSILQWSLHLAGLVQANYRKYADFLAKQFWLTMIKSRFDDQKQPNKSILEDAELLELGTRELELKGLERDLTEKLIALNAKKKVLGQSYENYEAGYANYEAGKCLQYHGQANQKNSNLAFSMLGSFMKQVLTGGTLPTEKGWQLRRLEQKLVSKTDKLMKDCNTLVDQDINPNKMTLDSKRMSKLEQELTQLDQLQSEVSSLKSNIANDPFPVLRPIMVKNSSFQVKTKR